MSESSSVIQLRIVVVVCVLNAIGWFWTSCRITSLSTAFRSQDSAARAPDDQHAQTGSASRTSHPPADLPFVNVGPSARLQVPGVASPEMCDADQVDLSDDTSVIGVEVDGLARAYVVAALEVTRVTNPHDLAVHVVNDMIGGWPVSVTYCNLTHSTRVLTVSASTDARIEPIDLCVGGWDNGLVLVVDDVRYAHHDPTIPLENMEYVITTWDQWREGHPDSLVYTGQKCAS